MLSHKPKPAKIGGSASSSSKSKPPKIGGGLSVFVGGLLLEPELLPLPVFDEGGAPSFVEGYSSNNKMVLKG